MKEKTGSLATKGWLPKMRTGVRSALALIALAALCCSCTLAQENTATNWTENGLQLYKNESYEEASEAFDRAIELEPQNLDAWLYKSVAMTTLGMKITGGGTNLGIEDREATRMAVFGEAIRAHDRAVEISPENATVWIYKAGNLNNIGYYTNNLSLLNESLKAFDRALELDTENADAWHGKGVALVYLSQKLGDTSRYERLCSTSTGPGTEPSDGRGASEQSRHPCRTWKAERIVRYLRPDYRGCQHLWRRGRRLAFEGRRPHESGEVYRGHICLDRAAEIDPDDRWTWKMMAFAAVQIGWYNKSLEAYDALLALDANASNILYGKADALYKLQRFNESLQAFDDALSANPEMSSGWKGRGDALKALNRTDEAKSAYEKALNLSEAAIRIDTTSSGPWIEKGEALAGLGRFDEALEAYEKAIELAPLHFPSWQRKGDLLMEMGRYEEALPAYEKAIEVDQTFPRLWYYKGLALWALDRNSEAEEAFAKAAEMGYEVKLPVVKEAGSGQVVTSRTEIAPER